MTKPLSLVIADMHTCAHAALTAIAISATVVASLTDSVDTVCNRDGLNADYDTDCTEYVRCRHGAVTRRYACAPGRVFDSAAGACVSKHQHLCVKRICAKQDSTAYATPGTACRKYYRCENGSVIDHVCPPGAWFDFERQACTHGAGTCYEPLCAGLVDGSYPDSSHECRRIMLCSGAQLRTVISCNGSACLHSCPSARASAIPLPAGDADFCSDETCSSLCQYADDGAYADRLTGCHEYFVCEKRTVIRRGVCEPGQLFSDGGCVTEESAFCPPPARSPCFNRVDSVHRDWRDCSSWFECRRERVVTRGSCDVGLVFDGSKCVPKTDFFCAGPEVSDVCIGRPKGTYQDLESNCTRYFHCSGSQRIMLSCPTGQIFDGAHCVSSAEYLCPSLDPDSCYGRPDGQYRAKNAGCRGYYTCVAGNKAQYACPIGQVFGGKGCIPSPPGECPNEDYSCSGLTDGYHPDIETGCNRYFYCQGGDRLATLSCLGGKIFDGRACVDRSTHECGSPHKNFENDGKFCERDGFFLQQGTECKRYYFCLMGARTYLTCPNRQVFNGEVCVPKRNYECPG